MKYLVLGSSGQIGAPLCDYLRSEGNTVIEFDIKRNSIYQDLRKPNILNSMIETYQPNFVFFLAFDVGGSRYLKIYQDTPEFLDNNTKIILNTFKTLREYNLPFIFASSQMSNMSHSSYGILKALGEYYSKIQNGLTVKFWNVYGVEKDLDKAHVITDFILQAKDNKIINMLTDGTETRQFLHADDASRALYILSNKFNELDKTQPYHITNFEWTSIYEIANMIAAQYPGTEINRVEAQDTVQKNLNNPPSKYILNYWKPEISVYDGIKLIVKHYEKQ